MIERDSEGYALTLYTGWYTHHESNRFCPRPKCVAQSSQCAHCHVPRLTPRLRAKNLVMYREGKRDASDPGTAMTMAEAKRRGWLS